MTKKMTRVYEVLQRQGSGDELTFLASFADYNEAYMFAGLNRYAVIIEVTTTREDVTP